MHAFRWSALVVGAWSCNHTELKSETNHGGRDYNHFASPSFDDCLQRCCDDSTQCHAFTWTSYQPHGTEACTEGASCCWLKSTGSGKFVPKANCTSGEVTVPPLPAGLMTPQLTHISTIAHELDGNLRDPSAMVKDPKTGLWHFWVVYIPGDTKPGWHGYLHHYSADAIEGPWTNRGLALNHSTDPQAWDYQGMFSPSAIYDEDEDKWFLFYSATGANDPSNDHISAQLVASASSPDGPWIRLGVVASPTGSDEAGWNRTWNARRCDSGRAMIVNGKKGYWTKGVRHNPVTGKNAYAEEGAYFPVRGSSFAPPYKEWANNPIYRPDGTSGSYVDSAGYENCEFFMGPDGEVEDMRLMHILCSSHTKGAPHFISYPNSTALKWTFVERLSISGEPTPVYVDGMPGDKATVTHFIRRDVQAGRLVVGLYKLEWFPHKGTASADAIVL